MDSLLKNICKIAASNIAHKLMKQGEVMLTPLSPAQMRVLKSLKEYGCLTCAEVAQLVWNSPNFAGVAGRVLRSLDRYDFVETSMPYQNKRKILWCQSAKGLAAYTENLAADKKACEELLQKATLGCE